MANFVGLRVNSATSDYTYAIVTSASVAHSLSVKESTISLHIQVVTGPSTSWGTGGAEYERRVRGTVNGVDIGTHIIKPRTAAWVPSTTYDYDISFVVPYVEGTTRTFESFRIENGLGQTGVTSTFMWQANTTIPQGEPAAPTIPANIRWNGGLKQTVKDYSAKQLTWNPVANATHYDIYVSVNGAGFVYGYRVTHPTTSALLNPASQQNVRGTVVSYNVRAANIYKTSGYSTEYPTITLAKLPTMPTTSTAGASVKQTDQLTFSWSGATAGSGSISNYRVWLQVLPKDTTAWVSGGEKVNAMTTSYTYLVSSLGLKPGDKYRFTIKAYNSYGLESETYTSATFTITGGTIKAKVSGAWRDGEVYVKVNGAWRKGQRVFTKVNGSWREGV